MSKLKSEIERQRKTNRLQINQARKCKVAGCDRPLMKSREKSRDYVCCHHFHKRESIRQPITEVGRNQKHNAATRRIPYSLSRKHWYYLNYFTLYWKKKGNLPDSLSIDRIDNNKGYSDDNVQVVDRKYNSKKGSGKDWWED